MTHPPSLRWAGRVAQASSPATLARATALAILLLTGATVRAQSDAPVITSQPQSLTTTQGMTATFSVTASGTEPLAYQWFRYGTNLLEGSTNSTLLLSNVVPSDAATYRVIVTNQFGADTSLVATLTVVGLDFGDAPDPPFRTLLARDGARHVLVPGVYLGSGANSEPDGQPAPDAVGDNITGSGDDGVRFPEPFRIGRPANIQVVASTNGFLNAWFDFDHTNGWAGPGDHLVTNLPLQPGTNTVPIDVPTNAVPGQTFARFRFCTMLFAGVSGQAPDGEVEDYALNVPVADLAVTATASAGTVSVGGNLTFTLVVTNRGPTEAADFTLGSQLSPLVQLVSVSTTRGICTTNNSGGVTCLVSNLAAGGQFTATINCRAGPGTNSCVATLTGPHFDPVSTNDSALATALGLRTVPTLVNGDTIIFDDILSGRGSVYPSTINVSGLTGRIHKVTVTLHGLSHSFPDDLDALLVGPGGRSVLLMSDCGNATALNDLTLIFDDDAPGFLPNSDPPVDPPIVSGPYRPSNCASSEDLLSPAPPRPYGTQLGVFLGTNPNGTWSLFMLDDLPEEGGLLADGWSLNLVTSDPIADLGLTQTANAPGLPVGSNLVYTLIVTNQGPANTSATVVDTLPPSVSFVSVVSSRGNCTVSGNTVTCALGDMNSGSGATITILVVPTLGGSITNLVTVTGGFLDLVTSNNTHSLVTAVFPVGDVAVHSAAVSGNGLLGQPLTYSIQVTNHGPNIAANFNVTNTLPAGMNFVSAVSSQGGCAHSAGVVLCSLGDVTAGSSASITIVGRPGATGSNTNRIRVSANVLDFVLANDTAELVTTVNPAADFGVFAVPVTNTVFFGQNWSQMLQVSNLGPSTSGATLNITLASQLQFVSAQSSQGTCSNATNMVFCDLGSVVATQNVSIALVTRPITAGSYTNLAVVAGALTDVDLLNNIVRPSATVITNSDLELRIRGTPDPVWLGENVTYVLGITNNGPNNATTVLLTNALPTAFAFVFANPSQGSCSLGSGNTVNCSLNNLAAGSGATVTIVGRSVAAGLVTNSARVSAAQFDAALANNSAILPTRVVSNSGRFTNVTTVIVSDNTVAVPYPSTIQVSGLTAAVFRVRVTLTNLTHTFPDDLDVLLVGPEGQSVVLMSDAGGEVAPGNVTLTFDEDAPAPLADSGVLVTGIFRPANYEETPDVWPSPAPPGPYGTNLNVFRGTNPNGVWSLYVLDDDRKDSGLIAAGWALTFSTLEPINDVLVTQSLSANPAAVSSNFVITCHVTNRGPAAATNVWLTNVVHPELSLFSLTPSQGSAVLQDNEVLCNFGSLASGASATLLIRSVALVPAFVTNRVTVGAAQRDLNASNNASEIVFEIDFPPTITLHPVSVTVTNGETVTFTAAATGPPPLQYQWQRNGVNIVDATNTTLALSNVTANQSGRYRLRVSNRAGVANSDEALLRVLGPPAISDIPDQEIFEDTDTGLIPFVVEDAESPPETIQLRGESSNPSIVPISGIVFDGAGSNRTVRVTPLRDAFGLVTISVLAIDPDESVTMQPFLLNILPVNDPPTISDVGNHSVDEDDPIVVNFVIHDSETLPGNMLYWITSSNPALVPTNNVVFGGIGTARTATINSALNEHGTAVVTIHAQDEGGDAVSDSFLVTIAAANDPPTVDFINDMTINEDSGPHELTLTGITSGAPDEPQQLIVSASSSNPTLLPSPVIHYTSPSNTAQLTFTSLSNAYGAAPITVTVRDGGTSNEVFSRTFTVTILPVNDPPILAAIPPVSGPEDVPQSVAIALSDPDDDPAAVTLTARSLNQSIVPNSGLTPGGNGSNRSLLVTPAPDAVGMATIQVIATDPLGAATTNSFTIALAAVNDPPRINTISNVSIPEDAPVQSIPLSGIRPGPADESGPVSISAISSNPGLIPNPSVLYTNPATTGALRLQPATNAIGVADITVTLTDDGGAQTARVFRVTVIATNDPPVIASIGDLSTPEDTPIDIPVVIGDADTPAPLLVVSGTSGNTSLVPNAGIVADGSGSNRTVRITPAANQSGNVNITLFVTDGAGTNSRTFQLSVISSNDPPTLNALTNMSIAASPGQVSVPLTGITAGPSETQALSVTVSNTNPALFQSQPNVNYSTPSTIGTLTFRPANNQVGSAVFTVTVTDNGTPVASFSRSFVLNVRNSTNTLPTISIITNVVTAEDTPTASIPFTIRDAETPAGSLALSVVSSNPGLLPNSNIALTDAGTNRTITLTPVADQSGVAAVTLTVTDAGFGSSNMTFTLTVNAVNDPPSVSSISALSTPEDVPVEVPFVVSDLDTAPGTLVVTATSSNQAVVPNANIRVGGTGAHRALVITPAQNQTGAAIITVRVTDGDTTNTTTFQLTIDGLNDPPVISDIGPQSTAEDSPTTAIQFVISDFESSPAALTLIGTSSNPSLVLNTNIVFGGDDSNRTVTITPEPNVSGTALITITVSEPEGGASATDTFALTIHPVNDPPTLDPIGNVRVNQNSGPRTVLLTGLAAGAGESNQTLSVSATTPDTNILRILAVDYAGGATATLTLAPVENALGAAMVNVVVNDGLGSNNLVSQSFTLNINGAPSISYVPDQTTLEGVPTAAVPITINDVESVIDQLVVTISSASPLVPPGSAALLGINANLSFAIFPPPGLSGVALVSIVVSDPEGASNTIHFHLSVLPDTTPTIGAISDQVGTEDVSLTIPFTVTDAETPEGPFTFTGMSSSPIIPPSGFIFGGIGSNRTVTVLSAANLSGQTEITISVTDQSGKGSTRSFHLDIAPAQDLVQIIEQPRSLTVPPEGTARFEVQAEGGLTLSYQWRRNGEDIPGATNRTLLIEHVQLSDQGAYTVLVQNDEMASALSAPAQLSVQAVVQILSIHLAGNAASILYATPIGATNTLEFKLSINAPNWTPVASQVATGAVMTVIDPSATNSSGFYRIRKE